MENPNLDFGDSGPQDPEDYLSLHFENGFLLVEESETVIISQDPWEYEMHTEIPDIVDQPKVWISDNVCISFEISGSFQANSKKSNIYITALILANDNHIEEEFDVHTEDFEHWFTEAEAKDITERFAKKILDELIVSMVVDNKFWCGESIKEAAERR